MILILAQECMKEEQKSKTIHEYAIAVLSISAQNWRNVYFAEAVFVPKARPFLERVIPWGY